MTPEQITNFVSSYLMMRGKPTEDGNFKATLSIGGRRGLKPKRPSIAFSADLSRAADGAVPNGSGFTAGHPQTLGPGAGVPPGVFGATRSNRFNAPCGCLAVVSSSGSWSSQGGGAYVWGSGRSGFAVRVP